VRHDAARARVEVGGDEVSRLESLWPALLPALLALGFEGATLAVGTYGESRANPVMLARTLWGEACTLVGDEGARALMRLRPELVREVPCTGSPDDIDTEEDLRRWQNS